MLGKTADICPRCGKEVGKRPCCTGLAIDRHFEGKPVEIRGIYDLMVSKVSEQAGPLKAEVNDESINLGCKSSFCRLFVGMDKIMLELLLSRKAKAKCIFDVECVGGDKYLHKINLKSKDEINGEFISLMKEAYLASA